jgi:hypothetical protein
MPADLPPHNQAREPRQPGLSAKGDTMHDDHNTPDMLEMDAREYERDEISDEEFCRSVAFFFEGVPDENQR